MDSEVTFELELKLLLEAIYATYHYDFRDYAFSSLRRRLSHAMANFGCTNLSGLQEKVLHDPTVFPQLLKYLTVQVSDMFRDPTFYKSLRDKVVPVLRTYPSLKIWVAGCAGGEEVWSLAILLREEGLLDRTVIYATDISPDALREAEAGIYSLDRLAHFTRNHQQSGGKGSLSNYYQTAYSAAQFDRTLKKSVVFSDHSLATDSSFGEMQLITCRNVLIYFQRELQDRALTLFSDSLCPRGFLGLGAKESLRFSTVSDGFEDLVRTDRLYQKR